MLDVRIPIGLLFAIVGALLVGQGLLFPHVSEIPYQGTIVKFNLNLMWGGLMGLFGISMAALSFLEKRSKAGKNGT